MTRSLEKALAIAVAAAMLAVSLVLFAAADTAKLGTVYGLSSSGTNLRVRSGPGTGHAQVTVGGEKLNVYNGDTVSVLETVDCDDSSAASYPKWYKISFQKNGSAVGGYVPTDFVKIKEQTGTITEDFEKSMEAFPESYRAALRELHTYYPKWQFVALNTGLEWSRVITEETKPGQNYVDTAAPVSHRSTNPGSYDWTTDTWIKANSRQYNASTAIVSYYIDPRNSLDERHIFQFESLSFIEGIHTLAGVEQMISKTFMSGKTISNGKTNVSYAQAYMDAAQSSGVSPYHLAARTIQEVGYKGSGSVTGTVSGYEGIYNFYNIGAYSTLEQGLAWAKNSGSYGRPWNSQYKSIVGGAGFIAEGYISKGQNTLYLEKFDVYRSSDNNLFWHQYMQTLTAPYSESVTVYNNYLNIGMLDSAFTFIIPVYKNMPASPCVKPTADASPNNWLKTLSVDGFSLTPTFVCDGSTDYSLIVENNISSINVKASAVSGSAKVTGTGAVNLNVGTNTVTVKVTAGDGGVKDYKLTVVRKNSSGGTENTSSSVTSGGGVSSGASGTSSGGTSGGGSGSSATNSGSDPSSSAPAGSSAPVTSAVESGFKTEYRTDGEIISGISPGTEISGFVKALGLFGNAGATVVDASGKTLTSGSVGTGSKVTVNAGGTTQSFTVVVYGDTNGDGKIDAIDLLQIRRFMLGTHTLKGAFHSAGDTDRSGAVDAIDLLQVRKNMLGTYKIAQ